LPHHSHSFQFQTYCIFHSTCIHAIQTYKRKVFSWRGYKGAPRRRAFKRCKATTLQKFFQPFSQEPLVKWYTSTLTLHLWPARLLVQNLSYSIVIDGTIDTKSQMTIYNIWKKSIKINYQDIRRNYSTTTTTDYSIHRPLLKSFSHYCKRMYCSDHVPTKCDVSDIGADIFELQHVQAKIRAEKRCVFDPLPKNTECVIDQILPRFLCTQFHECSPTGLLMKKSGTTKEMTRGEFGVTTGLGLGLNS
jgi:hypothetical protein